MKPLDDHAFTKQQIEDKQEELNDNPNSYQWNKNWGPNAEDTSNDEGSRWINPDKKVTEPKLSIPPPPNDLQLSAPYIHNYLLNDLHLLNVQTISIPSSKSQGIVSHFVIASVPSSRNPMNSAKKFVSDLCKDRINPIESERQGKGVYGGYFY
ncbi:hypothetical protein TL16_g09530 [Triparma laevis f. inornata]|uniref:Uncharacterized protein n=1 Tax=Triparma laevis f. inornata TaxID=1714386 RepID=A0A9W7BAG8_9STRA|nr:hypothetical protein TL16_g09530 [Triparma laevis f. inornata]